METALKRLHREIKPAQQHPFRNIPDVWIFEFHDGKPINLREIVEVKHDGGTILVAVFAKGKKRHANGGRGEIPVVTIRNVHFCVIQEDKDVILAMTFRDPATVVIKPTDRRVKVNAK